MNSTQNQIMNIASYVCDHICQKPKEITDEEKLEEKDGCSRGRKVSESDTI